MPTYKVNVNCYVVIANSPQEAANSFCSDISFGNVNEFEVECTDDNKKYHVNLNDDENSEVICIAKQ